MSGGLLGIGVRSLLAYQTALTVTSQNVENANTEFYSRQQVDFAEAMFNSGVNVSDVRRVFDDVSNREFLRTTSVESKAKIYHTQVSDFERILDDDDTNVNKYIIDSLKSLQDLTDKVGSVQSRTAFMTKLETLADRFRDMGAELDNRKSDLNRSIESTVTQANEYLRQIANISSQMEALPESSRGELFDQRNKLVHELARYVNFDASIGDDNILSITTTNGVELVSGALFNQFTTDRDAEDSTKLIIQVDTGSSKLDVTSTITGGQIAGLLNYRTTVLDVADNGMNRLALAMTDTFNKQNMLGMDLNGFIGVNIFSDINTSLLTASRVLPNANNTGVGTAMSMTVDDTNALTTSDYRLRFNDATNYSLVRLSDNTIVNSGSVGAYPHTISADGFTITMTAGTFAANDKFLLKPTTRAATEMALHISDSKSLALAFPVAGEFDITNKGSGDIQVTEITDTTNPTFATPQAITPPIRIEFLTDTSYRIVNATDSTVIEGPLVYDSAPGKDIFPTAGGFDPGYRVNLSGEIKAGDVFSLVYNTDTASNNKNALALSALYNKPVLEGDKLTFSTGYGLISNDISLKTNSAKIEADSSLALMKSSRDKFYEYSGVSLLEESGNLARYQEAYQASAQVIQAAKSIFDTIISIVRG